MTEHMIGIIFKEAAKQFSIVAVSFHISTSSVGEIKFLHILVNIWSNQYF
jgi:hypothetical protein